MSEEKKKSTKKKCINSSTAIILDSLCTFSVYKVSSTSGSNYFPRELRFLAAAALSFYNSLFQSMIVQHLKESTCLINAMIDDRISCGFFTDAFSLFLFFIISSLACSINFHSLHLLLAAIIERCVENCLSSSSGLLSKQLFSYK
jgi:hypothetical protein